MLKVLLLHNRDRQNSALDAVVASEARMLRGRGVRVLQHEAENPPPQAGMLRTLEAAAAASWSRIWYAWVRALCRTHRPDIAHVHNFWMGLSPSVHAACHDEGIPTVQTLHDFRLVCANAMLLRQGRFCDDCLGKAPWRGVVRRCSGGSVLQSAAAAGMIAIHRWRSTWDNVSAFIAPSEHARAKLLADNLPSDRIFVKPYVVENGGPGTSRPSASDAITYVGPLSSEKGLQVLLQAWGACELFRWGRLQIVGDGPAEAALHDQAHVSGLRNVTFTGRRSARQARAAIARSRAIVLPSLCLEMFGHAVVEAFSAGRPAVVSGTGHAGSLVADGCTGLKCPPGDPEALGQALSRLLRDAALADYFGENARREYCARYAPDRNFETLMRIYEVAMASRRVPRAVLCRQESSSTAAGTGTTVSRPLGPV